MVYKLRWAGRINLSTMSNHRLTLKCALVFHASDEESLTKVSLLKEDNRLSFLLSEWKELYDSFPYLLDDASAYIGDGAWRTDEEADDNYDFVWPDDGSQAERDLHDALLTTEEHWVDVSLMMKRFVAKPLLIRMPNFEVRAMIAIRRYCLDEEKRIVPTMSRYGLNLTIKEVITLIRSREEIQSSMDAHERAFSVRPAFPPDLPPEFLYHRHFFG